MHQETAVDFPGLSRIHIALAVTDVERSRAFYETLFGASPTKVRPDYVKFEPAEPSVNLTLNQAEPGDARGSDALPRALPHALHYGVQVRSTQAVHDAITRFKEAGLETDVEENTTCCYAVQDKVWITDPDGNSWEIFVVTEADAATHSAPRVEPGCCPSS